MNQVTSTINPIIAIQPHMEISVAEAEYLLAKVKPDLEYYSILVSHPSGSQKLRKYQFLKTLADKLDLTLKI